MKKLSFSTWWVLVFFLLTLPVSAQLSGTYTVGSGGDFSNLNQAVDSMKEAGVTGSVILNLLPGIYTEQIDLTNISGINETNTLTIRGSGNVPEEVRVQFNAKQDSNFVFRIRNLGNVIFRNFLIKGLNTRYAGGIELMGNCSHIKIDSMMFSGSLIDQNAHISNSAIHASDGLHEFIDVTNSYFDSLAYGIAFEMATGHYISGLDVIENNFEGIGYCPISIRYGGRVVCYNNIIRSYTFGFRFISLTHLKIRNNYINARSNAMYLALVYSDPEIHSIIANNIVEVGPVANHDAIHINQCSYLELVHNTIRFGKTAYHYHEAGISMTNSTGCTLLNNIILNYLGYYALYVDENSTFIDCDYNNIFSFGPVFAFWHQPLLNMDSLRSISRMNTHSQSVYFNLSSDTLGLPVSAYMDNAGLPHDSVLTDYYGNPRDPGHPDMGAVEYSAPPEINAPITSDVWVGPGGDYNSIGAAARDLFLRGIADSIHIFINSGVYNEQVEWLPIPGNDDQNRITLESASGNSDDVIIQYNANADSNYIFHFRSLPFISIRNLTFEPTDELHNHTSMLLDGYFSSFSLQGNKLRGIDYSGSTTEEIHLRMNNFYFDTFTIANNEFWGGSTALYLNNPSPVVHPNVMAMTGNEFRGESYEMLLLRQVNDLTLNNNYQENGGYGLRATDIMHNLQLAGNNFNVRNGQALQLTNVNGSGNNPSKIYNNFINHTGQIANNSLVLLNYCDTIRFVNNNLRFQSDNPSSHVFSSVGGSDIHILNSIFYNSGTDYAFYTNTPTAISNFDFNNFYNNGTNLAWFGQACSDLTALRQVTNDNEHSLNLTPEYVSESDLHVTQPGLNAAGLPVSFVTTDIDGDRRHPFSPDIGADEFSPGANTPPTVLRPIPDLTVDEDTGPWTAEEALSTVFEDTDPGDFLTFSAVSSNNSITATIMNDSLIVAADANYFGEGEVIVTAQDLQNSMARDTINVIIRSVPDKPIARPDTFNIMAGSEEVLPVLNNDSDPDGDILHIFSVSMPAHGQVDWQSGQDSIRFQAEAGYEGIVEFNYSVYDGSGDRDTATVSIYTSDFLVLVDSFPGVANSANRWIDMDNDKDLDVLIAGATDNSFSGYILSLYENRDGNFQRSQVFPGIRPGHPQGMQVLDIDNDLDMDFIVSGGLNGTNQFVTRLYLNNGLGHFHLIPANLPAVQLASILPVDFDKDGDSDLWIQGDSTMNATILVTQLLRNDGLSEDGRTFQFTDITPENLPKLSMQSAAWADYDKDGDPDVAISGAMTEVDFIFDIFQNVDGSLVPLQLQIPQISLASMEWADVDSDSDLDLIFSGYVEERPIVRRSGILINEGNNQFTLVDGPIMPLSFCDMECIDFDNDGDLDISILGRDSIFARYTKLYLNSNGQFSDSGVDLPGLSNGSINWADYDKDNDADLLISGIDSQGKRHTYLYKNIHTVENQKPDYPRSNMIYFGPSKVGVGWYRALDDHSQGAVNTYNVAISDKEGMQNLKSTGSHPDDGTLKYGGVGNVLADTVFIMNQAVSGKMYFFRLQTIDGAGISSEFSPLIPVTAYNNYFMESYCKLPGLFYVSLAPCDVDTDGLFDLALSGSDDDLNYMSQIYIKGINAFVPDLANPFPGMQYPDILWQDINGDGQPDIFLSGFDLSGGNGYISQLYLNNNNHYTLFADNFTGVFKGDAAWGDYDNDGDPDLLIQGVSGSLPYTKLYINQDSVFIDSGQEFEGLWWGSVEWGDVDNDGDLDILMCGNSYTPPDYHSSLLYLNNNGIFTLADIDLPDVRMGQARFADTDNDGDLDIIILGESLISNQWQPITILLENDNMNFVPTADVFNPLQHSQVALADFDNDGDLDIAYTGTGGMNNPNFYNSYLYFNNNGQFELIDAYLGGYYLGDFRAADFNGDSKVDILGGGKQTGFDSDISLFVNRTTHENEPPAAPTNLSVTPTDSSFIFSWDAPSDDHTPTLALTYNMRIGTQPSLSNIKPCNSTADGYHFIPTFGNVGHRTSWELKNPPQTGSIFWTVQAIDQSFAGSEFAPEQQIVITGIGNEEEKIPTKFSLYQNSPNPFNPGTNIRFDIPQKSFVRLSVYNLLGQKVKTLVNQVMKPGQHSVYLNGETMASGVYIYRIETEKYVMSKKLLLIK